MAWPDRMDVTIERARDRHVTDSVCVCVWEREKPTGCRLWQGISGTQKSDFARRKQQSSVDFL